MQRFREYRLDILLALLLVLGVLVYEAVYFTDYCYRLGSYGLELSDAGGIFYGAQVVERGGVVNRDYYTFWGPWPYYYHALFLDMFGDKLSSVKYAIVFFDGLFALILYLIFRLIAGRGIAFAAALCLSFFGQRFAYGGHGYVSFYTLTLGWLAFFLFLLYTRKRLGWMLILAGFIAGSGYGFKFNYALYIIAGIGVLLYLRMLLSGSSKVPTVLLMLIPSALLAIAIMAFMMGMIFLFAVPVALCGALLFCIQGNRPPGMGDAVSFYKETVYYGLGVMLGVGAVFVYYAGAIDIGTAVRLLNPVGRALSAKGFSTQFADYYHSAGQILEKLEPFAVIALLAFSLLMAITGYGIIHFYMRTCRGKIFREKWISRSVVAFFFIISVFHLCCSVYFRPGNYADSLLWSFYWVMPLALIVVSLRDTRWVTRNRDAVYFCVFGAFLMLSNFPLIGPNVNLWGGFIAFSGCLFLFVSRLDYRTRYRLLLQLGCLSFFSLYISTFVRDELYGLVERHRMITTGKAVIMDEERCDVYVPQSFAREMQALKRYVQERTSSDERIFVASAFPIIYPLTDRYSDLSLPVLWEGYNAPEQQEEIVSYLKDAPIRLVVAYEDRKDAGFGNLEALKTQYPLVYDAITNAYMPIERFGKFVVHEERQGGLP